MGLLSDGILFYQRESARNLIEPSNADYGFAIEIMNELDFRILIVELASGGRLATTKGQLRRCGVTSANNEAIPWDLIVMFLEDFGIDKALEGDAAIEEDYQAQDMQSRTSYLRRKGIVE